MLVCKFELELKLAIPSILTGIKGPNVTWIETFLCKFSPLGECKFQDLEEIKSLIKAGAGGFDKLREGGKK